jgi:hypothetical protein
MVVCWYLVLSATCVVGIKGEQDGVEVGGFLFLHRFNYGQKF